MKWAASLCFDSTDVWLGTARGRSSNHFSPQPFICCTKTRQRWWKLDDIIRPPVPDKKERVRSRAQVSLMGGHEKGWGAYVSLPFYLITGSEPSCTHVPPCTSPKWYFCGDNFSYEFTAPLAPLLCHCNFTVGSRAFGWVGGGSF